MARTNQRSRLAIVIPTLNEAERIATCLDAIAAQTSAPDEIVIADGGSTDGTLARASSRLPATKIIKCNGSGRGVQIADGVAQTHSDIVAVLHADSILPKHALACIRTAFEDLNLSFACLRISYDQESAFFSALACVNALKASLFGISFGDQVQIFRSSALAARGGFPSLPLMEDLELSLRFRDVGCKLLPISVTTSSRRWTKGRARTIARTLAFAGHYIAARCLGREQAASRRLFAQYYPNTKI